MAHLCQELALGYAGRFSEFPGFDMLQRQRCDERKLPQQNLITSVKLSPALYCHGSGSRGFAMNIDEARAHETVRRNGKPGEPPPSGLAPQLIIRQSVRRRLIGGIEIHLFIPAAVIERPAGDILRLGNLTETESAVFVTGAGTADAGRGQCAGRLHNRPKEFFHFCFSRDFRGNFRQQQVSLCRLGQGSFQPFPFDSAEDRLMSCRAPVCPLIR